MTDTTDPQTAEPGLCPNCQHPQHLPGTECDARVDHGPSRFHACLCLARPGAASACPPQMTCQGGTLGYADIWYLQQGHSLSSADGVISPEVLKLGPAAVGFPSHDDEPAPSAAVSPPPATVKQRADLTEAEWAEQERARFERLYTREFSRAETATRDADIYQARLERLGEGYTRERKRAERAEAEAERLRTYRDATCICQHTEQQHFEDACLVCDCGDYLVPEAAREVIARWREAAGKAERIRENADFHLGQEMARRQLAEREAARLSAGRGAVLNAAAKHLYTALFPAVYDDMGQKAAEGVNRAVSELRRMADEEQQAETQAHQPSRAWKVESPRRDKWASWGATYDEREWAQQMYDSVIETAPQRPFRLVRAETTYTVEAEHVPTTPPAVVAEPGKEA